MGVFLWGGLDQDPDPDHPNGTHPIILSLSGPLFLSCFRYRLVPYGNHSYLESLTDKSKDLPL